MRRPRVTVLAIAAFAGGGCDALLTEPSNTAPAVQLALSAPLAAPASYGDLSGALAAVRRVHFRFLHDGTTRDTLVAGVVEDGALHARVTLRPYEARGWLEIHAELRTGDERPLFRGLGLLHAPHGSPTASIELTPVVWSIAGAHVPRLTALGDTVPLAGQPRFANNLPIEGAPIAWESEDPAIVEVILGDRVVARGNGTTDVIASSLGTTAELPVVVTQLPAVLTGVGPADTTVSVGATFQARPFGEDRNGYPLLPGASVQWLARGAVSVTASGVVTANAVGTGFVDAAAGPTVHTAQITVTQ